MARLLPALGCLALLASGCGSVATDPYDVTYRALTTEAAAPSAVLLAEWDALRDGTFDPDRMPGRDWLRYAWHAAAVGRNEDARAAIQAAVAADARWTRVARALAESLPEERRR